MTPILFLASDSAPDSSGRRLARIAAGLNRDRFKVETHTATLRNLLDWTGLRKLKRIAAALQPKIVHAWGPAAVRASQALTAAKADGGHTPRLVVSDASFVPGTWSHWWTRRRLRSCDRVVAATWVEAERYRGLGVLAERLTRIAPGIEPPPAADRAAILRSLGLPEGARFIVASGKLDHDSGMKLAVWGFDLIRLEFPDLHLVIVGDGPARETLLQYALSTMYDAMRVHFPGDRPDGAAIVAAADFAWSVHPNGDVRFALEAMAAGVPVFAWRLPEMSELIDEGITGSLATPADPADIAGKTYAFIRDESYRRRIGDAGRADATERFPASRESDHYASLYSELENT